jgi:hypothetical protein
VHIPLELSLAMSAIMLAKYVATRSRSSRLSDWRASSTSSAKNGVSCTIGPVKPGCAWATGDKAMANFTFWKPAWEKNG